MINRLKQEYDNQRDNLAKLEEKLEKIVDEQTKLVENDWPIKKLDLVPGDLLLDNLCKVFGVRFKKAKDSIRLASLMDKDKIDPEIKEILKKLLFREKLATY